MLATIGYALAFNVNSPAMRSASCHALRTTSIASNAAGSFTFTPEECSQIERELNLLRSKNEELQGQIEGVSFSQEELDLIGNELASLASDKEALKGQVNQIRVEKKALLDKLQAKEDELVSLASDKEAVQATLMQLREEKQVLMDELQAKEMQLAAKEMQLKGLMEAKSSEPETVTVPKTTEMTQMPKVWPEDAALGPLSSAARIDELERQIGQLRNEKATLRESSRRHLEAFKASIQQLEGELKEKKTELSTAQFHLDRTEEMLIMTQDSYEKFRDRSTLKLLVTGMDRDLVQLSKSMNGKYASLASKIGTLRRRMWLNSVGSVDAPVSASSRSLLSLR